MLRIRTTKTRSGATAIQVVRYVKRKAVLVKHIGSAHRDNEREKLLDKARQYVEQISGQKSLWKEGSGSSTRLVDLNSCRFHGVVHTMAHEVLCHVIRTLGFRLKPLLRDLIVMRMVEPCSKLRSLQLLEKRFGIVHRRQTFYEILSSIIRRKQTIERLAVIFARKHLDFNCSIVLYDVTTLYFESFKEDKPDDNNKGLRKTGFSKDNKPQQPQIILGLITTSQGFPLGYEIFRGNTFEGHTMLPIITSFQKRYKVKNCTIVADAAMLSTDNIGELVAGGFSYIVGARVANMSQKEIDIISSRLNRTDGKTIRLISKHGDLICSFSKSRFYKDKNDMEKQASRAKRLVASGEPGRRAKFVLSNGSRYAFNEKLLKKTKKLLGIKGYVTNIPRKRMKDKDVIEHYRNLWKVEHAFRMSKDDLEIRPIFHYTENAIKTHIIICFIALATGKYMEIVTGHSLRRIIDTVMEVTDAIITDENDKRIILRSELSDEVHSILMKLGVSH